MGAVDSRARRKRRTRHSDIVVAVVVVAAALGGALAGTHATGTPVVDPLYAALAAGIVTLAASRAGRETHLILAVLAAALSRGWVLVPGAGALAVAFGSVWAKRRRRRVGALTGALAMQAVLRWPAVGFRGLTALVGFGRHRAGGGQRLPAAAGPRPAPDRVERLLAPPGGWRCWPSAGGRGGDEPPGGHPGAAAAQSALDGAGEGNTAALSAQLRTAANDFATAHREVAGWWTLGSRRGADRGPERARAWPARPRGLDS